MLLKLKPLEHQATLICLGQETVRNLPVFSHNSYSGLTVSCARSSSNALHSNHCSSTWRPVCSLAAAVLILPSRVRGCGLSVRLSCLLHVLAFPLAHRSGQLKPSANSSPGTGAAVGWQAAKWGGQEFLSASGRRWHHWARGGGGAVVICLFFLSFFSFFAIRKAGNARHGWGDLWQLPELQHSCQHSRNARMRSAGSVLLIVAAATCHFWKQQAFLEEVFLSSWFQVLLCGLFGFSLIYFMES